MSKDLNDKYADYDGSIELPNLRHEKFCLSYVEHFDRQKAVKDAGYEVQKQSISVIASRLLSNVNVQKRIEYLRKLYIEETKKVWQRNALDVLHDINLIKERCMGNVLDENLKQYKIDHKTALKALEMEGQYLGMWDGNNIQQEKQVYIEGVDELED